MIGAIIGDIVGSIYEGRYRNIYTKEFEFFKDSCRLTDDSILTLAIAEAITDEYAGMKELSRCAETRLREVGRRYPNCGYGHAFKGWLWADAPHPYNSFGNGAAMRISPVGFFAKSTEEAKDLSHAVTGITHDNIEGMKGAEAVAVAIVLARQGASIAEIKDYINRNYYDMYLYRVDEMRWHTCGCSCQDTVPPAIECFLESTSFEDAIRNAVSIGGDSDTIAAMAGGIAEAYYGVPKSMETRTLQYFDDYLKKIYLSHEKLNKIVSD